MATRIESDQGIQLRLPEGSTVIIVHKGSARTERSEHPKRVRKRLVDPRLIREVLQDLKTTGADDTNLHDKMALLQNRMELARDRGGTFEEFDNQLDTILRETRLQQEGSTLGTLPLVMEDARKLILNIAEEVWTAPQNVKSS